MSDSKPQEVYKSIAAVTKTCRRCGENKPLDLMKRETRNKDGYSSFCKDCHKAASIAWQKANPDKLKAGRRNRYGRVKDQINEGRRQAYDPEKARWDALYYRYKATREWYEAKLAEQGGKCAICGREASLFGRMLSVDHDHRCCPTAPTCGQCTRGLLCATCNAALHSIERDRQWLLWAFSYLGFGKEQL